MTHGAIEPTRLALTVSEAGRVLGISRALAYQLAKQGDLPTVLIGSRMRVPRAALEAMLTRPREEAAQAR